MYNFKEFLTEMFDEGYPIILISGTGKRQRYVFETEDGRPGDIEFVDRYDSKYGHVWELGFKVGGRTSRTGEGDAYRIFATVMDAMIDFRRRVGDLLIGVVSFVAVGGGNKSRIKLYRRLLKKYSKLYDFTFSEGEEDILGVDFYIFLNKV